MQVAVLAGLLPVVLMCFGWSTYNLYHGGFLHKNKGWKTKEESPITFWISVLVPYVIGLLSVWGFIDPHGLLEFLSPLIGPLFPHLR
jgi:hypothetical protein